MTPLEQQVREALTDEVIDDLHRTLDLYQVWASVRRQIINSLRPLLEQQAAAVATLTAERDEARGCTAHEPKDGGQ